MTFQKLMSEYLICVAMKTSLKKVIQSLIDRIILRYLHNEDLLFTSKNEYGKQLVDLFQSNDLFLLHARHDPDYRNCRDKSVADYFFCDYECFQYEKS